MDFPIMGAGGGGKGGGGGGISEAPDTLRSSEKAIVLDALCEGPVQGLVNGAQSVYFDGVPLQNGDGTWNFNQAVFGYTTGTLGSNSNGASSLTGDGASVESTYPVATKIYQATPLVQSITTANVDTVRVTLNVPSLTSTDASSGKLNGASVEFTIGIQTAGGGYVIRVHDTINGKTSSNYARSYVIPLSGAGPFDIQVTRITPDSGSSLTVNDLYWQDYTSIISTHLEYRHTAMAYTAIDAQQFSSIPQRAFDMQGLIIQVPSNYNPTTRVYTGTWDGTFQLAWSDNPAWCFYDLLTNSRYGLGDMIPATSLNKWQLYVIGQYCDQMVSDGFGGTEPRFTCNLLIQGEAEAYTVVQNMASIFRGMAYWSAGSIAVTQDAPATPVQSFTPANVIGGVFNYQGTSLKARHTVALVTWNDPAQQYKQVVEYVQDDALVAKYGVVKAQVTAMGCTSRGQAHRWGQWLLYTENLETEAISFKASLDGTFLTPGAIIQTSDPNRAGARMGGRVLGISPDGLTLTLDSAAPSGSGFTVQVAFPDGTMGSSAVSSVSGNKIVLPAALAQTPVSGAIFILSETTLVPEQWRVVTISESAPNEVQIGATTYNSTKYPFIEDGLPLAVPQISTIQTAPATPINLAFSISRYFTDAGPSAIRGTLSWTASASSYIVTMQKVGGGILSTNASQTSIDFDNIDLGHIYTFGVTAVSAVGVQSQPATLVVTPVATDIAVQPSLPNVTGLELVNGGTSGIFTGQDAKFDWRANSVSNSYNIGSEPYGASSGALDGTFKDYKVVIEDTSGNILRTEFVTDASYIYTYEKNFEDGNGVPNRAFQILVWERGTLNQFSAIPAILSVSNPAPPTPLGAYANGGPTFVSLGAIAPDLSDLAGMMIWMSTTSGFTPSTSNQIYAGKANTFVATSLTQNQTYYFRLAFFDTFTNVVADLNLSSELSALVVPAGVKVVSTLPTSGMQEGDVVFLTTDKKIYRYDGTTWTTSVSAADVAGQLVNSQLAAGAVSNTTIAAGAVDTLQLNAGAVTTNKIAAGQITTALIQAGAITGSTIAAGTITSVNISSGTITAGQIAASTITAAQVAAGLITAGNGLLSTIGIGSGYSPGGYAFQVDGAGNTWSSDYVGVAILIDNNLFAAPTANISTEMDEVAVFGSVSATNTGTSAHGVRGKNSNIGSSGLVGAQNGWAFYAEAYTTGKYGPFTGAHEGLMRDPTIANIGDILVDVSCVHRKGISDAIFEVTPSTKRNQKAAIGIMTGTAGPLTDVFTPCVFVDREEQVPDQFRTKRTGKPATKHQKVYNPILSQVEADYHLVGINSVGEGQMSVCGEGGDIIAGDFIVTSSMAGKGMKQSDGVMHDYTVAKAREGVKFKGPKDVQMVACIYLCG